MSSPKTHVIPHPPIVWEHIRAYDIAALLVVGAVSELLLQLAVLSTKIKPVSLKKKEDAFTKLEYDTNKLRAKGPSVFVECSKSERALLAADKELQQLYAERQQRREFMEKVCFSYAPKILALVVFILYYGVSVISFSGPPDESSLMPKNIAIPLFFPLSVAEVGFRTISCWGLEEVEGAAASSLGALVVMWSSANFVRQLMEGMEHLVLASS